eukprot:9466248-Pyramimonas_sp.AAC.1
MAFSVDAALAHHGYVVFNECVGYRDGKPCFKEHCITFDEHSANAIESNIIRQGRLANRDGRPTD